VPSSNDFLVETLSIIREKNNSSSTDFIVQLPVHTKL